MVSTPTSKCYEQIYDFVVEQKQKAVKELEASIRKEVLQEVLGLTRADWHHCLHEVDIKKLANEKGITLK